MIESANKMRATIPIEKIHWMLCSASQYYFDADTYLQLRRVYPGNKIIKQLAPIAKNHCPGLGD